MNSTDLMAINLFQFENLVRNRIPFILLNQGVPLAGRFPSHLQEQMERQMKMIESDTAWATAIPSNEPKHSALIVIAADPLKARTAAQDFFNLGYENVYYLNEPLN